jgi:protein ImuA
MEMSSPNDILQKLRQDIRRLEGFKSKEEVRQKDIPLPAFAFCLPGAVLAQGAVHEFISEDYAQGAASTAFTLALLSSMSAMTGPVIWIARDNIQHMPGFAHYGFDPQRIIFLRPRKVQEALWVMEEALRYKGLTAVIGEAADADLTATRRLQLAAEESGVIGFLHRPFCRTSLSSSCMTRWKITPAPSMPHLPGLGAPRWQVELLKARGGQPGTRWLEWRNNILQPVDETQDKVPVQLAPTGDILPLRRKG